MNENKSDSEILKNWVGIEAFPFIIPLVEQFELGELTLGQCYQRLDQKGYQKKTMYEYFNCAFFVRNRKFPENMITIPHEAEQGKIYGLGICILSQPRYNNTVCYVNGEFKVVPVRR